MRIKLTILSVMHIILIAFISFELSQFSSII